MAIRIASTAFRRDLANLLRQVEYDDEKVIVLRNGQAVTAMVSMDDWARIRVGGKVSVGLWRRAVDWIAAFAKSS
jgi:prevent-host-death family protein